MEESLRSLLSSPQMKKALQEAGSGLEEFVQEWTAIARIPAPSGGEKTRADYLERRFRELGLVPVTRDAAGNVIGLMKGIHETPRTAFCAHMDTVAPATADHTVRRSRGARGGILSAPGVRDDSAGLAALLAAVTLMRRNNLLPYADTWFVASAREEAGLVGAERFVRDHAADLGAFIAVDGSLGQVSYASTGIVWLKLEFEGEGAHTLKAHEKPSALLAAARAIEEVSAIPLRRSPETMESWLNIGTMGSGDVPNAQPAEAWFTVDLRSNDAGTLASLERKVGQLAGQAARRVGVQMRVETLHRMPVAMLPGAESSRLVMAARRVLESLSWAPIEVTRRGTADHNVAIAAGIPGIAIGVTTGDGAHTAAEYADIEPFVIGLKQLLLLAVVPINPAGAPAGPP